jgi:hypothetical protein
MVDNNTEHTGLAVDTSDCTISQTECGMHNALCVVAAKT